MIRDSERAAASDVPVGAGSSPIEAEPALTAPATNRDWRSFASGRLLLPTIAIGTMLAPLNSTMIAVALPELQASLGVSVTATAWLVTLYLVVMAAGQPIGGRLGDLLGRRNVYLIGLAWFAIASLGCAFSPNLLWLIVFRTQQAMAGALSFPNGSAMVREAIPAERRGSAFGMVGLATGIAAGAGPPLGGLLVQAWGWSSIFWANVPVVAIALALGWPSLPRHSPTRSGKSRFDIAGTLLLVLTLGLVILIPTFINLQRPWLAIGTGALGLAAGWAFVTWELRARDPVVDVRLFRKTQFAAACAGVGLGNLVMYTTLLALPLYLEGILDKSIQQAGLILAALSVFSAVWGPFGGRWTDRVGRWLPAVVGGSATLVGALLLAGGVNSASVAIIVIALAAMGVGVGVSSASLQTTAVESVPLARTGSAAGMYSTSRYLGSVAGSTLLAAMFTADDSSGQQDRFLTLFVILSVVAVVGVIANNRIATR